MRRTAVLLAVAVTALLLAACSPPVNAVVGIGYDDSGRLVAVVKVCDDHVDKVRLQSYAPDEIIARWRRDAPLRDTEGWYLRPASSGHWRSVGPTLATLDPATQYALWAEDGQEYFQGDLPFRGRDLQRLRPGQLLVRRDARDQRGNAGYRLIAIPAEDMIDEICRY